MKLIFSTIFILCAAQIAAAQIVEIKRVRVENITQAELNDTVIPEDVLVSRKDNRHDLRIGDGVTPGGIRVKDETALTEPPTHFPHDVHMQGNRVHLNPVYTVHASGSAFFIRAHDANVLAIVTDLEGLGETEAVYYEDPDILVVVLNTDTSPPPPIVELAAEIPHGQWVGAEYTWTMLADDVMEIRIEIPPELTGGYFRISAALNERIAVSLPIEAPEIVVAGTIVSAKGQILDLEATHSLFVDGGGSLLNAYEAIVRIGEPTVPIAYSNDFSLGVAGHIYGGGNIGIASNLTVNGIITGDLSGSTNFPEKLQRRDAWRHYPLRAIYPDQGAISSANSALGDTGNHTPPGIRMPGGPTSYAKMDFDPAATQVTARVTMAILPNETNNVYVFQWRNSRITSDLAFSLVNTTFYYTNTVAELHSVEFEFTTDFPLVSDLQKGIHFSRRNDPDGNTATNTANILSVQYKTLP